MALDAPLVPSFHQSRTNRFLFSGGIVFPALQSTARTGGLRGLPLADVLRHPRDREPRRMMNYHDAGTRWFLGLFSRVTVKSRRSDFTRFSSMRAPSRPSGSMEMFVEPSNSSEMRGSRHYAHVSSFPSAVVLFPPFARAAGRSKCSHRKHDSGLSGGGCSAPGRTRAAERRRVAEMIGLRGPVIKLDARERAREARHERSIKK